MTTIGSFRDAEHYRELLPKEVEELVFGDMGEIDLKFELNAAHANLNHAAFGASYTVCTKLSLLLRKLSEDDPALFYDKLLCPLIMQTLLVARSIFKSPDVFLVPNLTIGIKTLLESLLSEEEEDKKTIAILEPIYGATRKLIKDFLPNKRHTNLKITTIEPGLFVEDSKAILEELEVAFSENQFRYLVADHVTSQTGRILPIDSIITWCKEKNVVLIIDGTQSMDLKLDEYPPYYIFSTHKWLANIKTCGLLRVEPGYNVPDPCGISFGYGEDKTSAHLWTGMQDYIPHVVLGLALRIYEKHGLRIRKQCSEILNSQLQRIGMPGVLPHHDSLYRTINLVKVNRFDSRAFTRLQDALDMKDVRVSVKQYEEQEYLRVSVFVYSESKDFNTLGDIIDYKLNYQYMNKAKVLHEFQTMMTMYDALFEPLHEKAFFVRAEPLRHHLIFYYGHTGVFYINKLVLSGFIQNSERIDRLIESSCAVGVDEMSWDDLNEDNYPWTDKSKHKMFISKIKQYRETLREKLCHLVNEYDFSKNSGEYTQQDLPWIILMGVAHEQIHIETSACIIHQLQAEMIDIASIPKQFRLCDRRRYDVETVPENKLVAVAGGSVELGRSDSDRPLYFGWDNEFGSENATLEPFQVSQMLVSNAEYLQFINSGGYTTKEFWTEESWLWASGMKRTKPLSWINLQTLRTTYQEIPIPWDWPVEVNSYEADAFCVWKSKKLGKSCRLISHEEWFLLRSRMQGKNYNLNLRHWGSSCPVDCFGESANEQGEIVYDITGNVWQHSSSVLTLLQKGFKTHPAYDDFTTPTIDGKHNFIVGGSWISCGNPTHLNARYGFRKHFQQFAGIRYVVSSNSFHDKIQPYFMNPTDCSHITDQYLDFTKATFLTEAPESNWYRWFGKFAASMVPKNAEKLNVIMVNASVGRTTLEFIRSCSNAEKQLANVMHTDLTATKLRVLEGLIDCGMIRWDEYVEGDLVENHYFCLDEQNLEVPTNVKISYRQLDTNNIDPKFCNQDIAIIDGDTGNFKSIDRIYAGLVKPGGILILASIVKVKSIPGYDCISNDSSAWKITRKTGRMNRVAKLFASAWKRTDIPVESIPSASDIPKHIYDDTVYYESENVVQSYEKFHFGSGLLGVPNFSKAIAEFAIRICKERGVDLHRALDVGSGPGRTAIELVQAFQDVTAIDFSSSFIEMCKKNLPSYVLPEGHKFRAVVGDAHGLVTEDKYDLVVAINLIDRLSTPKVFLEGIKPLLSSNGILIVASPFTWLEEFTKKDNWLGGFQKWGETHRSIDGLKEALAPELQLVCEPQDIPFVISDPDGSYQYTLSQTCVFAHTKQN